MLAETGALYLAVYGTEYCQEAFKELTFDPSFTKHGQKRSIESIDFVA